MREHKLRLEMVGAKKRNEEYRQLVDQGKALQSMEQRKAGKAKAAASSEATGGSEGAAGAEREGESASKKKKGLGGMTGDLQQVCAREQAHFRTILIYNPREVPLAPNMVHA